MKKNFQLTELKANQVIELEGWEQKQKEIVEANPFIQITDPKSYDQAKKNRTALKTARTEVQSQDKLIGSTLSNFRKETKVVAENLIAITSPHEEKQQEEVSRYEAILEERKNEKERLEKERVDSIQNNIENLGVDLSKISNRVRFEDIEESSKSFEKVIAMYSVNDYQEFEVLFDSKIEENKIRFDEIIQSLKEKEDQRIEAERIEKERKERKKPTELNANVLKKRIKKKKKNLKFYAPTKGRMTK